MRKYLLLAVMLSACYFSALTQPSSQTRTATQLNNFQGVYVDSYPKADAEDVAADDGIYAYSRKLTSNGISYASLALQGFGFTIPADATIDKIEITVRRFKKGKASIRDYFVSVLKNYSTQYGIRWDSETHPGNYPETESEFIFSENGTGNDGGFDSTQFYLWTPEIVNHPYFGVRFDVWPPEGVGSVSVYYDYVQIKIDYTQPEPGARISPGIADERFLKEPIVYPNPFTTKTNIKFTVVESGSAVVELYDISGTKLRTLFSGHVVEGRVYNIPAGDARLPSGIYIYMIRNGKQKHIGRIIKLE